jgi:RHS repeat-associated protein
MTDTGGNAVWKALYEPFGKATVTLQTITNNVRLAGQYFDQETGLHYNWHRYYDPKVGRYISSDPIGLRGGLNTYVYVRNNPLRYTDPLGLWSTEAHNKILRSYFPNLSPELLQYIKDGSQKVDRYYQTPEYAYMHSMRAPGQSREDAARKACDFIRQNLQIYQSLKDSGIAMNKRIAYKALGEALHTVMDSTSPSHRGFQIWDPAGDPQGSFKRHGNNSPEDEDHLTDALLRETLNAIDNTLRNNECGCAR